MGFFFFLIQSLVCGLKIISKSPARRKERQLKMLPMSTGREAPCRTSLKEKIILGVGFGYA